MEEGARALAIECARLAHDDKCEGVVLLDVRGVSQVTDYLVIATGTSERQMRSVLDHVVELAATRGSPAFRVSVDDGAAWLVADFVHVVVHIFEMNARAHYDLELLWGGCPSVAWQRDDQKPRDRARLKS